MKCYLTKRANGRCLLTFYRPKLATVGTTSRLEAWPIPGDPLSWDCCWWSAVTILGADDDMQPLDTIIIRLTGVQIDGQKARRNRTKPGQ